MTILEKIREILGGNEYSFSARGQKIRVDIPSLSDAILAQAALHGLKQTISDAASNAAGSAYDGQKSESDPAWKDTDAKAKRTWATSNATLVEQEASALMDKRLAALMEGDWTTRASAAPGMSKFEEYAAELVAGKMPFEKGTKKAERLKAGLAKYEELPQESKDKVGKLVKARIEREREEAAMDIDLDF